MKLNLLLLVFLSLAVISCNNDDTKSEEATATEGSPQITINGMDTPGQTGGAVASATGAVHHYICPNNCAGSGGPADGKCPVCGTQYKHNDAFHQTAQGADQPVEIKPNPDQKVTLEGQQKTPEPAQNAKGVWHYTCPKGCAGGAGTMTACAKCGTQLQHNTVYHQ